MSLLFSKKLKAEESLLEQQITCRMLANFQASQVVKKLMESQVFYF